MSFIPQAVTWLKMKFLNAFRICVHECIFDPLRVLLGIPGSTISNEPDQLRLSVKRQTCMAAKPYPPPQPANPSPSAITGQKWQR